MALYFIGDDNPTTPLGYITLDEVPLVRRYFEELNEPDSTIRERLDRGELFELDLNCRVSVLDGRLVVAIHGIEGYHASGKAELGLVRCIKNDGTSEDWA